MKKPIIFTDLDGTLLDFHTYSFDLALPALAHIKTLEIPLIICSSKTRAEIEFYRSKLDNTHPFISENGGGIFIPEGYFNEAVLKGISTESAGNYVLIRLGASYNDLREALGKLRAQGFQVVGFGDMSVDEVSVVTGLSFEEAHISKERDFDEPFINEGPKDDVPLILESIQKMQFKYTRGRFFHILGNSDKGKSVETLTQLYRKQFSEITTIALGDNPNDVPMLKVVDIPVVVMEHDRTYNQEVLKNIQGDKKLIRADGVGPEGWNKAVFSLLESS